MAGFTMFRGILGVIAGYIVMVVIVVFGSAGLLLGFGESFASQDGAIEGTVEATAAWYAVEMPLALVAAILGGFTTALVAPSPRRRPVMALAGLVLVLGFGMAVYGVVAEKPAGTGEGPSGPVAAADQGADEAKPTGLARYFQDSAEKAAPPTWYNFTIPVLGVVGVLIGGCLRRRPPLAP